MDDRMNDKDRLTTAWNRILDLKPCPFCGSDPEVKCIGNDHSRTRKISVKCSNKMCRAQRTDASLRDGFHWLEGVAEEGWNLRPESIQEPTP